MFFTVTHRAYISVLFGLSFHFSSRSRDLCSHIHSFLRLIFAVTVGRNSPRRWILSTLHQRSSVSHPASSALLLLLQLSQLAVPAGSASSVALMLGCHRLPPLLLCFAAVSSIYADASVGQYINS